MLPDRRIRVVNMLEEGVLGGPQRRSVLVAAELAARPGAFGADTTLLFPRESPALEHACEEAKVDYRQLPIDTLSRHPRAAMRYPVTIGPQVWRIANYLKASDVDLVHVSGGSFCWKGPLAARLAGVPFAWHLNDTGAPGAVREVFKKVARVTKPAHIIYAGYAVRDYYGPLVDEQIPSSIVPAPYGVAAAARSAALDDPFNDDALFRILMLANVNPVKGLDFAIDAIVELRSRGADADLYIAGAVKDTQVPYHDALRARAHPVRDAVHFLGYCSDVAPYLAHADMAICTSRAEASPLAVWEAAASGKPIVSADVGDVARTLPDEEAALIVPVGDVEGFATSIQRLIKDPKLRQRLGTDARRRIQDGMSISAVADASLAAYQATI